MKTVVRLLIRIPPSRKWELFAEYDTPEAAWIAAVSHPAKVLDFRFEEVPCEPSLFDGPTDQSPDPSEVLP